MTAIVLLGAGASYGSGFVHPFNPPLGKDLFSLLERRGGVASRLPDKIKEVFRSDFEKGMAAYSKHTHGVIMQFQREMAHCFAEFVPAHGNVYRELVGVLGIDEIIYCSLNYDLLLELSAASLGFGVNYSTEMVAKHMRLLKLHGSCNFWPDIRHVTMRGCVIGNGEGTDVQMPINPLCREATLHRCVTEDSLAPAMSVYAIGKAVKVSPTYVERQQQHWRNALVRAENIFISGVRIHAADKHIWAAMENVEGSVTYFGFPEDRAAFDEWKANSMKRDACFVEANFSECITTIKSRLMGRKSM